MTAYILSCIWDYFIWLVYPHYLFCTFSWSFWLHVQVVTGASLCSVARKVIHHVRFPLLDPEHLSRVEKENEKTMMIPVRVMHMFHTMYFELHDLKKNVPRYKLCASLTCTRVCCIYDWGIYSVLRIEMRCLKLNNFLYNDLKLKVHAHKQTPYIQ